MVVLGGEDGYVEGFRVVDVCAFGGEGGDGEQGEETHFDDELSDCGRENIDLDLDLEKKVEVFVMTRRDSQQIGQHRMIAAAEECE